MKFNSGQFVADGNAVNVDVGFIPDFVFAIEGLEESTPQLHYWFRSAIDSASAEAQFGIIDTGGTKAKHAAAVNGFAVLDTTALKLLLPNPAGGDDLTADLPNPYTVARSTAATARTATALGTVLKPSLTNVAAKFGLVFECITAGTGSAEPTWPTVAGGKVLDNDVEYIAREENIENRGVKGFTLGATGQDDSDEWKWMDDDLVAQSCESVNIIRPVLKPPLFHLFAATGWRSVRREVDVTHIENHASRICLTCLFIQ